MNPSETAKPPRAGIKGFIKATWIAFILVVNACFWNAYEFLTPHRKFGIEKESKRSGDNVVITGGGRGIGKEVVRKLLMLDMNIIMGVRNVEAAKNMIEEFRTSNVVEGTVDIFSLDLKSLESVRKFASYILLKYNKVHIIINNAGIHDLPYELSGGIEITFQVNYLAHFLLTQMLLPRLVAGGTVERPSRIVHVCSVAHYPVKLDMNDFWMQKMYGSFWAYGNSKLMQAVFSRDLNNRLVDDGYPVRSDAVHPGCVYSGLYDEYPKILRIMMWIFFKNNKQGADGVLYVALSPEVDKEGGKYYQNCTVFRTNSQVNKQEVQMKLWDASCKAVRCQYGMNKSEKLLPEVPISIIFKKENEKKSLPISQNQLNSKRRSLKENKSNTTASNKIKVQIKPEITFSSGASNNNEDDKRWLPTTVGGNE